MIDKKIPPLLCIELSTIKAAQETSWMATFCKEWLYSWHKIVADNTALAAARGTGVLLVGNTLPAGVANFLGSHVQDAHIFGGNAAVAASVARAIEEALFAPGGDIPVPPGPGPVAVTGVKVDPDLMVLKVGDTETITATVEPSNASDKRVTWSSDTQRWPLLTQTAKSPRWQVAPQQSL
jgi:hypothetical protein